VLLPGDLRLGKSGLCGNGQFCRVSQTTVDFSWPKNSGTNDDRSSSRCCFQTICVFELKSGATDRERGEGGKEKESIETKKPVKKCDREGERQTRQPRSARRNSSASY
jgi:hypothetical protein